MEYLSGLTSDAGPGALAGSLPSNVPCSSSASGVHLGLSLPIATVSGPGLEGRRDFYQVGVERGRVAADRIEGPVTEARLLASTLIRGKLNSPTEVAAGLPGDVRGMRGRQRLGLR
jgi:hypothetical protein